MNNFDRVVEPVINVYSKEEFITRLAKVKDIAPIVQFDVTDGIFAAPKNFVDPQIVFNQLEHNKVHIHLMVNDQEGELMRWQTYGPRRITYHVENTTNLESILEKTGELGIERGLAIAPVTPLEQVSKFVKMIDFLLVVSVPPGRGGQQFSLHSLNRLRALHEKYPEVELGVDGGVNEELIQKIKETGAKSISVGKALFSGNERENYFKMQKLFSV